MSRYTAQVKNYVDMININKGINLVETSIIKRIQNALPIIFDFEYPIWNERDRKDFETDFLLHYYMAEIGAETIPLWKLFLADWLRTNMPYYNMRMNGLLYLKDFQNLFDNINTIETGTNTENVQNSGESGTDTRQTGNTEYSGGSNSTQKYYETPSHSITDITDHLNNITQQEMTNHYNQDNESATRTDSDFSDTRNLSGTHQITKQGYIGVNRIEQVQKYLSQLTNLKKQIFDDASTLFMEVY